MVAIASNINRNCTLQVAGLFQDSRKLISLEARASIAICTIVPHTNYYVYEDYANINAIARTWNDRRQFALRNGSYNEMKLIYLLLLYLGKYVRDIHILGHLRGEPLLRIK